MAKWDEREGNSCHIHFSLADAEGPLFPREESVFCRFLAGQLAHLRELTLLLAPNVNSYKRYTVGSFAPTTIAWGRDNRTCALRVVGHGTVAAVGESRRGRRPQPLPRAEAIIAAGLAGSTPGCELEPPVERRRLRRPAPPRLPTTLREARELFAASDDRPEAFGEEVVAHYVNAADVELAAFGEDHHRLGARSSRASSACDRPSSSRRWSRAVTDGGLRPGPLADRVRGDGRAPGNGDQARAAAPGHAPAGRARALRAPGIARSTLRQALTRARPDRPCPCRSRSPRRDLRRRPAAPERPALSGAARPVARGLRQPHGDRGRRRPPRGRALRRRRPLRRARRARRR